MKAGAHGGSETPPKVAQVRIPARRRPALDAARESFATAVRRYREQRATQERGTLAGYLCKLCLDAPAVHLHPAPWGGEMGVCPACRKPEGRTDGDG
jgi:hypothetical protein